MKNAAPAHLPALDGVRALLALAVAFYHLEIYKPIYEQARLPYLGGFVFAGHNAVVAFFALSGMLITWLLLQERGRTGSVSIGTFYLKRVLRIWPVYYLVVGTGIYLLPHVAGLWIPDVHRARALDMAGWEQGLYLTFFANVFKIKAGWAVWYLLLNHAWSIGLEEQFYAVWPWLARLHTRLFMGTVVGIIAVYGVARVAVFALGNPLAGTSFLSFFCADAMAWGALAGYTLHRLQTGTLPDRWRTRLQDKRLGLGIVAGAAALLFGLGTAMKFQLFLPVVAAWFSAALLVLALQPGLVPALRWPVLQWLGRISYGLYMYNPLALVLTFTLLGWLGLGQAPFTAATTALYAALGTGLTIGLAAISYYGMERRILRLRKAKRQEAIVPA